VSEAGSCCTTRLENTHETEFRELLYPWHPWFGLRVGIHSAIEKPDGVFLRCSLRDSDADRWLEVPAWMFDRSACTRARAAADAHVDIVALTALATLLRRVLNERFASSNAPLSSARLSHEANRGEIHAKSHEADAGALPRAVADGSVCRGPSEGHRRHAGVVRASDGGTNNTDQLDNQAARAARRQKPAQ
jgi:hypothetical protein